MSAPDLRTKQPLHADGLSASNLRVVLISDQPLYREGMACAFREAQSLILLDGATVADAAELARSRLADMVLIDTRNLGDAIEMAKTLASQSPDLPIVAVMDSATANDVRSAFDVGVRGCIFKRLQAKEFVRILQSIGQGASYAPPELGAALLRQEKSSADELTAREAQVLACVARALTNKEIARELEISEKTVKHYMTVIMEKLRVRNRVEAVLKARCLN
jgi:two-component system, NarL family, nitrate/nitrite response regulator NarL